MIDMKKARERRILNAPLLTYYDLEGREVGVFGADDSYVCVADRAGSGWGKMSVCVLYDGSHDRRFFLHHRHRHFLDDFRSAGGKK